MRNTCNYILCVAAIAFSASSCAYPGKKDSAAASEDKRTKYESEFDPLGSPGDYDVITQDVPAAKEGYGSEPLPDIPPAAPPAKQADHFFSVQVYASKSSTEADDFKKSIDRIFEEEIRIEYQAPYYRVCVGRSQDFDEGEALLKKISSMGFPKAWLVKIRK